MTRWVSHDRGGLPEPLAEMLNHTPKTAGCSFRFHGRQPPEKDLQGDVVAGNHPGMSTKELLLEKIADAPEPLLEQLLDFARFLRANADRVGRDFAVAGAPSLSKDWLSPEEGEGWDGL
jgi:hypothetical protein